MAMFIKFEKKTLLMSVPKIESHFHYAEFAKRILQVSVPQDRRRLELLKISSRRIRYEPKSNESVL